MNSDGNIRKTIETLGQELLESVALQAFHKIRLPSDKKITKCSRSVKVDVESLGIFFEVTVYCEYQPYEPPSLFDEGQEEKWEFSEAVITNVYFEDCKIVTA